MKKYLIIGGAGFIGFNLSAALFKQGNDVVIIDNSPVKTDNANIKRYTVSAEDKKKIAAVFKKERPDFVIYLAGPMHLRRPIGDPLFSKDANFLLRINIALDACNEYHVKKIIFASSGGAIYQNALEIPTKEDYLAHPDSLYGLASLVIEKYIALFSTSHNLNFSIGRFSNVYGPNQWESGIIPSIIIKMINNKKPIIYGSGNQTRDFIYIDDAVLAIIALAQKGKNRIYNVGSGKEISLNRVLALVKKMLGASASAHYKTVVVPETKRSAIDIKKIKKELGWRPQITMEKGLLKTVAWYKEHEKK